MRILFVSPDIEEKARGINFILKSMIYAAKESGHEVGLLTGYPHSRKFDKDSNIASKIEHLHLQHYLNEGRDSFRYMVDGGYRRLNILKAALTGSIFKVRSYDINPSFLSKKKGMLNDVDFIVKAPYIYQFLTRNYSILPRFLMKRIAASNKVDLVIVAAPSTLRSSDVGQAKLGHFIHDAMPFELVEAPPDNDTPSRFAKQFYTACNESDILFTNSQDTKDKVLAVNKDANVSVVYGTPSSKPSEIAGSSILERKNLKPGKYLLFASTLEKRKNVETLLEAYSLIIDEIDMPLVLVGGAGYGFENIKNKYSSLSEKAQKNIKFMGYVSEADKFALFENAFSFVFPSVYEGFGLIILEAMQSELPVISTKAGALKEAGGDAALYIENPYDPHEIAAAIKKLIKEPELRKDMVAKGKEVLKKYTHEKFVQRFSKALESLK